MPVSSSWWVISFRRRFFLCIRLCWVTHATQRQCPVMIMNSFSCEELWVIWPFLIPRSSLTSGPALFTPFFNSSCGFDPEGSIDLLMFCRQPEIVKYDQVCHFARQGLRGSGFLHHNFVWRSPFQKNSTNENVALATMIVNRLSEEVFNYGVIWVRWMT